MCLLVLECKIVLHSLLDSWYCFWMVVGPSEKTQISFNWSHKIIRSKWTYIIMDLQICELFTSMLIVKMLTSLYMNQIWRCHFIHGFETLVSFLESLLDTCTFLSPLKQLFSSVGTIQSSFLNVVPCDNTPRTFQNFLCNWRDNGDATATQVHGPIHTVRSFIVLFKKKKKKRDRHRVDYYINST